MARQRVVINVGGKQFQTFRNTLKKWPDTLLSDLDENSIFWDEEYGEFFFDRDSKMFSVILNFYRFGEVHLPHNVCGPSVRRELEFWGIQDKTIAPCCWKSYNSYQDQERCISMIEEAFGGGDIEQAHYTGNSKTKKKMNSISHFLEEPNSSKGAKIFSWIFGLLLIMTVSITIMSSQASLRVRLPGIDMDDYANETNSKIVKQQTTRPHLVLRVLDYLLLCFFTVELILRFIVFPQKTRFLHSFFNIVDLVAVLPKWTSLSIEYSYPEYYNHSTLFWVMGYLSVGEVFRVLRILKLAKNFTGLKVLILTVRASLQEMALLLFIVITGSVMFAVCIYFSEFKKEDQFPDMAVSSYWALITMTSVGYGDMYPQTHWGRFIAILCAIAGIFCTGLPIPIIANNFDLYYSYARIHKAMKEREKERAASLKQKLKKDNRRAFDAVKAIVGRSVKGSDDKDLERPPFCTPRDPNSDPLAPFHGLCPDKKNIIIRTIRRKRQAMAEKKKLKSRATLESKDSLAISIPSTEVTDISSPSSSSHSRHSSARGERETAAVSPRQRSSAKARHVQVSPAPEPKRRHGLQDIDDLDLL